MGVYNKREDKEMKHNWTRYALILVILALVYSVIAFTVPFTRNAVFYMAYGCSMLLIFVQMLIALRVFGSKQKAASILYGIPMVRVGWIMAAVQLLGGIVMMLCASVVPPLFAILAEAIFLGLTAILLVINDAQKENLTYQDKQLKEQIQTMQQLQAFADQLAEETENQKLLPKLRQLSKEMRFSDPVSSAATAQAEAALQQKMEILKAALDEKDEQQAEAICTEVMHMLSERNRICRLNK